MTMPRIAPRISRYLTADDLAAGLAYDVRTGLSATPKALPPKYFYDARGSELFEEITRLEEYYPTRTEERILRAKADDIVRAVRRRHAGRAGLGLVHQDQTSA